MSDYEEEIDKAFARISYELATDIDNIYGYGVERGLTLMEVETLAIAHIREYDFKGIQRYMSILSPKPEITSKRIDGCFFKINLEFKLSDPLSEPYILTFSCNG